MKFARSYIKYLYSMRRHPHDWVNWHGEGNFGDAIQSLAMENLYLEMGVAPENLLLIPRDAIDKYDGEPCLLPLQGWFGYFADIFPLPWSKGITPFFSGFHLTSTHGSHERFVERGLPELMRPFQPIGCRDCATMYFLRSQGLNAYFSGCLTLTFDKRRSEPQNGRVFLVDIEDEVKKRIPPAVMKEADQSITHYHYFSTYPVDDKSAMDFEDMSRRILDRYKNEARMVITSRIHAALPCLAMGIPVVFLDDKGGDERFGALKGLIPIYKPHEMSLVNWNPDLPDVEPLKQIVKRNFFICFKAALVKHGLPVPPGFPDTEAPDPDDQDMYMRSVERLEAYEVMTMQRQLRQSRKDADKLRSEIENLREVLKKFNSDSKVSQSA